MSHGPHDALPRPPALPDRVWRAIVEGASDGIFVTDSELRVAWVNERAAELLETTTEKLVGRRIADLVDPGDLERDALHLVDLRAGRSTITQRVFRTDLGTQRTLEVSARSVGDGYYVGIARDATERIAAEQTLARSEASFRALIENSPDGVAVHRDGLVVYANPALARILAWPSEQDMVGRHVLEVVHPDDRAFVVSRLRELSREGAVVPFTEERLVRRDGSTVTTSIGATNVLFEGEPAVAAVVRDVTEQKRIYAQLTHADRLASLGVLAAGVAHEINNPLAYVMLRLEAIRTAGTRVRREIDRLRERLGTEVGAARAAELLLGVGDEALGEMEEHVATASEGAQRVRRIVQDLRVFARADGGERAPTDTRATMELAVSMASHELRNRAELVRDLAEVPPVLAAQGQLAQVFLNLLLNAAQAIPEGNPAGNRVNVRVWSEGRRVLASVSDTGRGIPAENVPRLFEPFFTTKPAGEGCGLGLTICDGIVASLGGKIRVDTREGGGSTFTVDLPAAPEPGAG